MPPTQFAHHCQQLMGLLTPHGLCNAASGIDNTWDLHLVDTQVAELARIIKAGLQATHPPATLEAG